MTEFAFLFERSINAFNSILMLLCSTAILGRKNKHLQILFFLGAFTLLMTTINSYYILDVWENMIAITVTYIYSLLTLKGGKLIKLSIATVLIATFNITTIPKIFIVRVFMDRNIVNLNALAVIVSRIDIVIVLYAMYYFTKKDGKLSQIQWSFLALLFTAFNFCITILWTYANTLNMSLEQIMIFIGVTNCIFFIAMVEFIVFSRISNENAIKTQNTILIKEKMYQKRNMETIRLSNEEISHLKHDFKNYILIIEKYIQNNDLNSALIECRKTTGKFDQIATIVECNPEIIALIINEKIQECKALNIDIKCKITRDIPVLDSTDFIIVFTNLMDNAIEHCSLQNEGRIKLEISETMGYIILKIENSLVDSMVDVLKLQTTKKDKKNHGIGHKSIKKILKNANGDIKYSIKDNLFVAEAVFLK